MNEIEKSGNNFVGYEYKELHMNSDKASLYADSYRSFGWLPDSNAASGMQGRQAVLKLKRDRKILNRVELTRLERHFEACMEEIAVLEKSKTKGARICALTLGIIGTVFIAGSTFAVTHQPPLISLCILLAVPGFLGWLTPYFAYKKLCAEKTKKMIPLIEQKYEELYGICEKGNKLL